MTEAETAKIAELARECLVVEVDFVEMGCYRGDTSLVLAEILRENEKGLSARSDGGVDEPKTATPKQLWLYDSFEGLPAKAAEDESMIGEAFQEGVLAVSKREVKARFLRAGLKVPRIKKAWFSELVAEDLPERIAFAFLDGDLYESTRESLALVRPKMAKGGVIAVHDYMNEALPGVTKAVEEFVGRGGVRFAAVDLGVFWRYFGLNWRFF